MTDGNVFNTPLFDTSNVTSDDAKLIGSVKGKYTETGQTSTGIWSVNLIEDGNGVPSGTTLSASFGFANGDADLSTPNVITGGSGALVGSVGTLTDTVVETEPNFVIEWKACNVQPESKLEGECLSVYEHSTAGTFGDFTFVGTDFETSGFFNSISFNS